MEPAHRQGKEPQGETPGLLRPSAFPERPSRSAGLDKLHVGSGQFRGARQRCDRRRSSYRTPSGLLNLSVGLRKVLSVYAHLGTPNRNRCESWNVPCPRTVWRTAAGIQSLCQQGDSGEIGAACKESRRA